MLVSHMVAHIVHTKHLLLLLLIRARKAHLLLFLVVHHLLDHRSGVAVEVAELAVLRGNFGGVDLGSGLDDVGPPFHLVDLVEVDGEFLARGSGFKGPGRFVDVDGVRKIALFVFLSGVQAERVG